MSSTTSQIHSLNHSSVYVSIPAEQNLIQTSGQNLRLSKIILALKFSASCILIYRAVNKFPDEYAPFGWSVLVLGLITFAIACNVCCRQKNYQG